MKDGRHTPQMTRGRGMLHHKDHFCSAFLPGGTLVWVPCNFLSRYFSALHKNLASLVSLRQVPGLWPENTFQSNTCSMLQLSGERFCKKLMGRFEFSEWSTCHKSPLEGQRHQPPQISAPPLFRVLPVRPSQ